MMNRIPLRSLRCAMLLAQVTGVMAILLLGAWLLLPTTAPTPLVDPLPVPPQPTPPATEKEYKPHMKTILFWNRYLKASHLGQRVGHHGSTDAGCLETRCFTADHRDGTTLPLAIEDFDMVVFHGAHLDLTAVPATRKQHQRYVLLLQESAAVYPQRLQPWDGFFNLTASSRLDSDIFMPYGWVAPIDSPRDAVPEKRPTWRPQPIATSPIDGVGVVRSQRRLAAWLASNCSDSPKDYEDLVLALAQYAPVDRLMEYGRDCDRDECDPARLAEHYDFYLSPDNSLCCDIVTEKLILALKMDLVPVVLGGADFSLVAPPGSYIDAEDFASPRHLADHLLALQADRKVYERHFWWKKHYEVRTGTSHVMCQMCSLLHDTTHAPSVVRHLDTWLHGDKCTSPGTHLGTWIARARHELGVVFNHADQHRKTATPSAILVLVLAAMLIYFVVILVAKWFLANRERWRK